MHGEYCVEYMGTFYESNSKELAVKKVMYMYPTIPVSNEKTKHKSLDVIDPQLLI